MEKSMKELNKLIEVGDDIKRTENNTPFLALRQAIRDRLRELKE